MIKLYTTETCPRCDILKKKLADKDVEFEVGDNAEIIAEGFRTVPILKVGDEYLDFGKAINFVNKY